MKRPDQDPVPRLPGEVRVINVGLPIFADALRDQGAPVVDVDWRIPAGGDGGLVSALGRLLGPKATRIDAANARVLGHLNASPIIRTVERAGAVIEGLGERTLLHCGPAITWDDMIDPLRRSATAAIVAEGWANNVATAAELAQAGEVMFKPANDHQTVVPMATVIGPSAPVYVVENAHGGTTAFSSVNQGAGEAPWFGVNNEAGIDRLKLVRDVIGPVLAEALKRRGGIDILDLAAQGVAMADDVHMRIQATTNLVLRDLLPALVRSSHPLTAVAADFLAGNPLTTLNMAMAAAKALADAAARVDGTSIVTTMARNGSSFGIRLGNRPWIVTDAPPVRSALFRPGFGPECAAPDIGDSAVLELIGLGAAVAGNTPAAATFLGGANDALALTQAMETISVGESDRFRMPYLSNKGAPLGLDVRRIAELSVTPGISTGIVHATDGLGQIGAGIARAPLACFVQAALELDERIA
ncbi:hypothetical protein CAF53_22475 [Sphingobium sp. LB126]|uniref:DUF1116 domain-containing protein n=1 Tax=Sphingobium sp. LB126 TaxID=1983755 RepID=UPI000C200BDB|nr:DUF1116 domain-containing protein [Sphingobium sp. LB126]PJG45507.1 hypothetical protein CAF53_22475 [Sphingobium sp. LB126]